MENAYLIRPNPSQKFRITPVQAIIEEILSIKLKGVTYSSENMGNQTREIAEEIKFRLKTCGYERYKFVVNVVLGEVRGEGVKVCTRCFWDSDTDNVAHGTYMNV